MLRIMIAVAVLALVQPALAQTITSKKAPDAAPGQLTLTIQLAPNPEVSMAMSDFWPLTVTQCGSDGTPFVLTRLAGMDITAFTHSGVVAFPLSKVNDVPNPELHSSYFVSDSGLYASVSGIEDPRSEQVKLVDSESGKETFYWRKQGEKREYIAQFSTDGSYRGAVKIELQRFTPAQIAAFDSGNFLVAGIDDQKVPHILLLNPSGQIVKFIELPDDITESSKSAKNIFRSWNIGNTDIGTVVMFAQFVPYRQTVLFVRSMVNTPVYEIRDGGEVRVVKIKAPAGYLIGRLIPSDRNWLVEFDKPQPGKEFGANEHVLYEVDPETGELLRAYQLAPDSKSSRSLDYDIACWYQDTFSTVRYTQGRLVLHSGRVQALASTSPE